MKQRTLILLAASIVMAFIITACGTKYKEAETKSEDICGGYFTLIKEWEDDSAYYHIMYANDTKVKYFVWRTSYKFGITPLYNADGSLQVYEESEEE